MIIRPGRLSLPMRPEEHFGRTAPLVLEIGFGDGRFLAWLGRLHPDWNLLGVELSMGSLWRAYRRLKREGIDNTRLFHGNARFVLRDVVGRDGLKGIFVNFPDPWPRKRQQGNRLLQTGFFELAADRLDAGGVLSLTTDHAEYYDFAVDQAEQTGLFSVVRSEPNEALLQTKYALKWQRQSKPIFHVEFEKRSGGRAVPAVIERLTMQHAVLVGSLKAIGNFEKLVRPFSGGHVVVLEAFRAIGSEGLLFKVLVEEPDLRQEVIVQAWQRDEEVYVALEPFGDPLGTRGVREAVRAVTDWLSDQGLEIRQTWI